MFHSIFKTNIQVAKWDQKPQKAPVCKQKLAMNAINFYENYNFQKKMLESYRLHACCMLRASRPISSMVTEKSSGQYEKDN